MRILITGICGFVGSTLAKSFLESRPDIELIGIDNFIRPGSEHNRASLKALGVQLFHGDIRNSSDLETLPKVDVVVDAAANPSVLAGVDGMTSSRQLVEHNLNGTINLLEFCKKHSATFILLSTSRVYSIEPLAALNVEIQSHAYHPVINAETPIGITAKGVSESFKTLAPVSLYGATKLASEALALDYGATFNFPVFINRCGVLAGAGQFGRPDQGIFAFWLNSHLRRRKMAYIGFDGMGHQVRDCLHPRDLTSLIFKQIECTHALSTDERIINCAGGTDSAMSLRQLTQWCDERFAPHEVGTRPENRQFDIPWMVLDSSRAKAIWNWAPETTTEQILDEIALHAEANPHWLELSAPL
jgi:Nucleoside-diphosphate-sugar epimerases